MKNAIILHGKPGREEYYDPKVPSSSNYHWIPWLQKQLIVHDIKADAPEVPHAHSPQYESWRKEVERFEIGPDTILVGHSCGGGFWFRWLSEHSDIKVGKVVLVAPSLGLSWTENKDFFDYKIDKNITSRTKRLIIFYSDNDKQSTLDAVKYYKDYVSGIQIRQFQGLGHFTHKDMKTSEFPELLEECLK
ncbi:hypothetical protein BVY00_00385 [bacterium G20]|nr:hypothetical protein BVY00_00385 [bacterium G20]